MKSFLWPQTWKSVFLGFLRIPGTNAFSDSRFGIYAKTYVYTNFFDMIWTFRRKVKYLIRLDFALHERHSAISTEPTPDSENSCSKVHVVNWNSVVLVFSKYTMCAIPFEVFYWPNSPEMWTYSAVSGKNVRKSPHWTRFQRGEFSRLRSKSGGNSHPWKNSPNPLGGGNKPLQVLTFWWWGRGWGGGCVAEIPRKPRKTHANDAHVHASTCTHAHTHTHTHTNTRTHTHTSAQTDTHAYITHAHSHTQTYTPPYLLFVARWTHRYYTHCSPFSSTEPSPSTGSFSG